MKQVVKLAALSNMIEGTLAPVYISYPDGYSWFWSVEEEVTYICYNGIHIASVKETPEEIFKLLGIEIISSERASVLVPETKSGVLEQLEDLRKGKKK